MRIELVDKVVEKIAHGAKTSAGFLFLAFSKFYKNNDLIKFCFRFLALYRTKN
jgi:hypothetical protein